MKKLLLLTPFAFALALGLTLSQDRGPSIPADLRDAPNSASEQLGVEAQYGPKVGEPPEPTPVGAFNDIAAQGVKDWTVLVYINAKNNLEQFGLINVNDMEKIGSTDRVNIVVEIGRMNGQHGDSHDEGDWTGVRRYYVTRDNDPRNINSRRLPNPGNTNMGDPRGVTEFMGWAKARFPARKYLVIMWNHGGGWLTGISSDDETRHVINARRIGEAVRAGGGADVLAFDACLMQMAEVAYEVKDSVKVVVGSEELVPGMGFPYSAFLGALARDPGMGEEALGSAIVSAYGAYYAGEAQARLENSGRASGGATLSALRTSALPELAARVKEFGRLAAATNDTNAMSIAKKHAIRYGAMGHSDRLYIKSPYADLHSFVHYFAWQLDRNAPGAAETLRSAEGLNKFIEERLIIKNAALGSDPLGFPLTASKGIAVYMPPTSPRMTREMIDRMANYPYADLGFNRATNWLDFVIRMFSVELRDGRDLPPQADNVMFG